MTKIAKITGLSLLFLLVFAAPAMAQERWTLIEFSGSFGVCLTVIGAAYGIARLASSALDGMARQPEVAGSIQTAMIIAAALIEGFTFYALYICSTAIAT